MAKKGLGKGLGALFEEKEAAKPADAAKKSAALKTEAPDTADSGITYIKLSLIEPNSKQPRREFDEEKLGVLADSIKENGLIQPIIVTASAHGMYKIVAGERRWRAARLAGLKTIPALIREYSDEEIAEVALVENLQREDLNPIEEALGYNLLMDEFNMTQDVISKKVGKSRSAVANSLRLLSLDDEIKNLLINRSISSGHARAILSVENPELRLAMAKKICDDALNVRQAEALAKTIVKTAPKRAVKTTTAAEDTAAAELSDRLSSAFGTKVKVSGNSKKGKIEIEYFGNDDLDRILKMFNI